MTLTFSQDRRHVAHNKPSCMSTCVAYTLTPVRDCRSRSASTATVDQFAVSATILNMIRRRPDRRLWIAPARSSLVLAAQRPDTGGMFRVFLGEFLLSPVRVTVLTLLAMVAFAANSLLCRLARKGTGIDAASFTSVRIASGALALSLLLRL